MPTPIQSPFAHVRPFLDVGIPAKYWKTGVVPGGKILITGNPWVDMEYLMMMAYNPNPGSVVYSGDNNYPQFSENGYPGQCVAFAKAVSDKRSTSSSAWKPGMSLIEFVNSPQSQIPSSIQGLMIACFDGQTDYSLALANKKHVAILLGVNRNPAGKPMSIIVVDQNYYNYAPYQMYTGKISKHTIPWGTVTQKWTAYARNYHIVNITP